MSVMGDFWARSAQDVDDHDVRHILWSLVRRQQTLETHLAEVVALLLFTTGSETPDLGEARYLEIVDRLTDYLAETNRRLEQMQLLQQRMSATETERA